MPQVTPDWSNGPMGPGWLIMFPGYVSDMPGSGGSGSDSAGDPHTFRRDKGFPEPTFRKRNIDDDVAIAIALMEL